MVGEIGFLIVIPLVVFAFVGRMIDTFFSSFPLFFLIGILCAIVASTVIIYRKLTSLLKEIESESSERLEQKGMSELLKDGEEERKKIS